MAENQSNLPEKSNDDLYKFKFSYLYLLLDFGLRWMVFGARRFNLISEWVFWVIQAVAIPILILYLVDKRNSAVQQKHKIQKVGVVTPEGSLVIAGFVFLILTLGTYITYSLYTNWSLWIRMPFALLTFLIYGIYILVVYLESVQTDPKEGPPAAAEEDLSDDEWRDEDDRIIIKLETDKTSLSQRVDAYTLESALFGALAFSGFVTIIASEKPVLDGIQILVTDASKFINMILRFEFNQFVPIWKDMTKGYTLISAIAVQTLISSMFFLSVIISRLRFNDILKRVDYSTRLAILYNEKEEEVHNLTLQDSSAPHKKAQEKRLQDLKTKISLSIYYADQSMSDLVPIVMYMSVFRNLGIISFLIVLITSALCISKLLAAIFTALSVLAYIYPFFDKWLRDGKLTDIDFFKRGRKFFPHLIGKRNSS